MDKVRGRGTKTFSGILTHSAFESVFDRGVCFFG